MKLSVIKNIEQFTSLTAYFTSADRLKETEDYFTWVLSAASHYLDTGDIAFLQNGIKASRMMKRVTITRQCLDVVAAVKYGKDNYIGKANKVTLAKNIENHDALLEKIAAKIEAYLTEKQAKAETEVTPDDLVIEFTELLARRVAKLSKAGLSNEIIAKILADTASQLIQADTTEQGTAQAA